MKEYILSQGRVTEKTIEGENLTDALKKNIVDIIKDARCRADCIDTIDVILDNKQYKLKLVLRGWNGTGDFLPEKTQEVMLDINGVSDDDLPVERTTVLKGLPFNPLLYDVSQDVSRAEDLTYAFGVMMGLVDEVALHRSKQKATESPYRTVDWRFPSLLAANPKSFVTKVLQEMERYHPNDDEGTNIFISKISEIGHAIYNTDKIKFPANESLGYYACIAYFGVIGKITALTKYRIKMGLSQKQLAEKVGISLRQLQNYENKDMTFALGNAKFSVIDKLAAVLNVRIDDLVSYKTTVLVNQD